MFVHL
jgi:hypothetical protein